MPTKSRPDGERRCKKHARAARNNVEPFQWALKDQKWYWGNVSKDVLGIAMEGQPTGTFTIRDASSPGDYTLTLRVDGSSRLIRIYVEDGLVGFTRTNLEFPSVVALVEYYSTHTLEDYNPVLKTALTKPLSRDDAPKLLAESSESEMENAQQSSAKEASPTKSTSPEPNDKKLAKGASPSKSTSPEPSDKKSGKGARPTELPTEPILPESSDNQSSALESQQPELDPPEPTTPEAFTISAKFNTFSGKSEVCVPTFPGPSVEDSVIFKPMIYETAASMLSYSTPKLHELKLDDSTAQKGPVFETLTNSADPREPALIDFISPEQELSERNLDNLIHRRPLDNDANQQALIFVIHHFMESVIAEMFRANHRQREIQDHLDVLLTEYDKHKKAVSGYENSLILLYAVKRALDVQPESKHEPTIQIVLQNKDSQRSRISVTEAMKTRVSISLQGIERIKNGLEFESDVMNKRYDSIKIRCDKYCRELLPYGVDKAFFVHKTSDVLKSMGKETDQLLQNMLKVNLATSPFDWLTSNTNKRYTDDLVAKAMALLKRRGVNNTNGTFLIRPSASRPGFFAMVVSMNDEIYNCLIEYKSPDADSEFCGYAFLNTNLYYSTLADFIRYYSLVNMFEHNDHLNTVLRIPALKYLASVRKRQRAGEPPLSEEDNLKNMTGIELDFADCFALDENADFERTSQEMNLIHPHCISPSCIS